MTRTARELVDNFIYHMLNRGNAKQEVFHKGQDCAVFINLMEEAKRRHPINILAYCIMPNHFHTVIKVIDSKEVSKYMHWLMTSHVKRYQSHYNTSGHIWQGRFKVFLIQEETHLLTALRYVEGNPVRAGLVKSAKDWQWSSHLERIGKSSPGILDKLPIELPRDWTGYIDNPLTDKELEVIRRSVNRRTPYGDANWQEYISKKLGIEYTLRPRGRPKKDKT